jgi:menaquinone-dependent protoporphyrinogen oxidase
MSRVLIVFATREGQTARIAGRIASRIGAAGHAVELVDAADRAAAAAVDPKRFQLLVFGASMHAGGIETELVDFIQAHRSTIGSQPRAFFLVLLSAATRDATLRERWLADARGKVAQQISVPFDGIEMIAGTLAYSKYSWPMKLIMRRIARQAGQETDMRRDYEYTDWAQVEAFADRLCRRIATPLPPH